LPEPIDRFRRATDILYIFPSRGDMYCNRNAGINRVYRVNRVIYTCTLDGGFRGQILRPVYTYPRNPFTDDVEMPYAYIIQHNIISLSICVCVCVRVLYESPTRLNRSDRDCKVRWRRLRRQTDSRTKRARDDVRISRDRMSSWRRRRATYIYSLVDDDVRLSGGNSRSCPLIIIIIIIYLLK